MVLKSHRRLGGEKMKRGLYLGISCFLMLLFIIPPAVAQMDHKMGQQTEGETKVVDGIKGRFKVTPSMHMLDLYLADAATDKVITGAKVKVAITMPDGKKAEKEFSGMKMGEVFSYMNTTDLSLKGKYSFDITAEVGNKKPTFSFTYEVK